MSKKQITPAKKSEFITVFGRTGYGKTYLIKNNFLKHYKRIIIFDTMNEYKTESGIDILSVPDFENTINSLIEYDTQSFCLRVSSKNFEDYCQILDTVVTNEFQNITLVIDEIDKFASPSSIEASVNNLYNVGRHYEVDIISASRRPNQVHRIITSQSHLLVLFHTNEPRDLAYIREYANKETANAVKGLKRYEYVTYGDQDISSKLGLKPQNISDTKEIA